MELITDKKTILIISQYFWPENFRVNELALNFKKKGYNVEILTATPNYPSGKTFAEFKKNPKKYTEYHDIFIHRVFQIARGSNKLSLALNYLSFAITSSVFCFLKLRKKKYDIIFGVQLSPIFSMIPAILCKKIFRKPLHFWVLDIWPDSIFSTAISKNSLLSSFLEKLCGSIYASADILFLSSNGFKRRLLEMGVNKPSLVHLPQWVEDIYTEDLRSGSVNDIEVKKIFSYWADKKVFLFAGNIGEVQDFPSILSGFKNSVCLNEIVLLIIGDGRYKETLIKKIEFYGLADRVFCLGRYNAEYMPFFYHYADFLVISLKDVPIFSLTLPGKIQSYMNSGTPIIGMVNGEATDIIKEANCGFTVSSGHVQKFSILIDHCCSLTTQEMTVLGDNGKCYAELNYNSDLLTDRVVGYF